MNITEQIVDEIERLQDLRLDDRLTDDGYKKLQDYKTALKVVKKLTIPDVSKPKGTVCPDCGDYGWIYDETGTVKSSCPCHY